MSSKTIVIVYIVGIISRIYIRNAHEEHNRKAIFKTIQHKHLTASKLKLQTHTRTKTEKKQENISDPSTLRTKLLKRHQHQQKLIWLLTFVYFRTPI